MNTTINQAIILAAGRRNDFKTPTALLEVGTTTLIERSIEILKNHGVNEIAVVVGYESNLFSFLEEENIKLIYSDKYEWRGTLHSLSLAKEFVKGDFLLLEGDLVYEERAIEKLIQDKQKNVFVITNESGSEDETLIEIKGEFIEKISKDKHSFSSIDGEFIGISKISYETYIFLLESTFDNSNPFQHYEYALIENSYKYPFTILKIDKLAWTEVDTLKQYSLLINTLYPDIQILDNERNNLLVKDTFHQCMGEGYKIVGTVKRLGGMNNNNYLVKTDKGDFALRMPGKGSNESVNRNSELENSRITEELGLNSKIAYFNEASGIKISNYIENPETLNITTGKKERNMELMAYALNVLHNSNRKLVRDFDPFSEIISFLQTIEDNDKSLLENFGKLSVVIDFAKKQVNSFNINYVPCHLDAWPENFIKDDTGKIYLIDWEYSANYDRLWDVISISLECEYTISEENLFLQKYFGRKPNVLEINNMNIFRILMDMYWSLWSLSKVSCGDLSLYDYSYGRYDRGLNNYTKYTEFKGD